MESGTAGLHVQRSNHSATLPPHSQYNVSDSFLLIITKLQHKENKQQKKRFKESTVRLPKRRQEQ